MSLLVNQTSANAVESFFVKANGQVLNSSTINANTISAGQIVSGLLSTTVLDANDINASTIFAYEVFIDNQGLTATPTELLLNGVPLATTANISSLSDWALDPAISTVQMNGNNLIGASTISCITINANQGLFAANINAGNGLFQNLVAFNSLFVSSNTSTISSLILNADLGNFSTLEAGVGNFSTAITLQPDASTLYVLDAQPSTLNFFQQINGLITNQITLDAQQGISFFDNGGGPAEVQISSGILYVGGLISTPDLEVSSINGAAFGSTSITVDLGSFSTVAATSISSLGAEIRQALLSTIVFSPSLNPSLGGVSVDLALGCLLGNVVGWGAGVFGAAAGTVGLITGATALYQGRQSQTFNTSNYELVNGTTQLQFSTLGTPFSTIYRFNNSADPQTIPGEEILVSTIYPPGIAVRSVSDPLYTLSTPSSTIQAFGQWVPVPEANPSSISTVQDWALFPALSSVSFAVGVPAVVQSGQPADNIALKGANIQLVGNYTDAKDLLLVSTISAATLLGANDNVFAPTVVPGGAPGLKIEAPYLFLSTPNVVNPGYFNGSTIAANSASIKIGSISTLECLLISTNSLVGTGAVSQNLNLNSDNVTISAAQLYLGNTNVNVSVLSPNTLNAQFVNVSQVISSPYIWNWGSISTTALSSGTVNAGSLTLSGLSTVTLQTTGSAGSGAQPAGRLVISGNDLDLGQQDLWCQQVRVGAGNPGGSAQTEIIWYSPDNLTTRGLGLGGSDLTIRLQSTLNSGTNNGYLLDTNINKPFFSTINQSTALMAVIPSTNLGSFGVSTLSFIPPLTVVGSFYSSTSQTVAGANTETPLTYNSQGVNVGGFTFAGSTITVPVAGLYEITHSIQFDTTSGGTNNAYFWLKKNGTNLVQSGSIVSIVNNGETLGTIAVLDQAAAGDQYAVSIQSPDNNMAATAVAAAGNIPAIPSIITNIKRVV